MNKYLKGLIASVAIFCISVLLIGIQDYYSAADLFEIIIGIASLGTTIAPILFIVMLIKGIKKGFTNKKKETKSLVSKGNLAPEGNWEEYIEKHEFSDKQLILTQKKFIGEDITRSAYAHNSSLYWYTDKSQNNYIIMYGCGNVGFGIFVYPFEKETPPTDFNELNKAISGIGKGLKISDYIIKLDTYDYHSKLPSMPRFCHSCHKELSTYTYYKYGVYCLDCLDKYDIANEAKIVITVSKNMIKSSEEQKKAADKRDKERSDYYDFMARTKHLFFFGQHDYGVRGESVRQDKETEEYYKVIEIATGRGIGFLQSEPEMAFEVPPERITEEEMELLRYQSKERCAEGEYN